MIYLLYTIHILVCLFLILVVLLQQGKGADLSVFGGGATQAAFGSRGAASLLHKLTVWSFVAFILTTVSISFATSSQSKSSVMSDLPEQSAPASEAAQPAASDQEQPAATEPTATPEPTDAGEAATAGAGETGEGGAAETADPGDSSDG